MRAVLRLCELHPRIIRPWLPFFRAFSSVVRHIILCTSRGSYSEVGRCNCAEVYYWSLSLSSVPLWCPTSTCTWTYNRLLYLLVPVLCQRNYSTDSGLWLNLIPRSTLHVIKWLTQVIRNELKVKAPLLPWMLHYTKNSHINPLQTKRRLLYLKTQSVPRCKHFSSRL